MRQLSISLRWVSSGAFILLNVWATAQQASPGSNTDYVKDLLPSVEGEAPYLWRPFSRFPIKVVVLDTDPLFTQDYYDAVVRAGLRWQTATKGAVAFAISQSSDVRRADIIIRFRTNVQLRRFGGYTSFPDRGGALIDLSATRTSGKPTETWLLERVATHEFGHALGICGHSPFDTDIMSLHYETREISQADVNTLRYAFLKGSGIP